MKAEKENNKMKITLQEKHATKNVFRLLFEEATVEEALKTITKIGEPRKINCETNEDNATIEVYVRFKEAKDYKEACKIFQ